MIPCSTIGGLSGTGSCAAARPGAKSRSESSTSAATTSAPPKRRAEVIETPDPGVDMARSQPGPRVGARVGNAPVPCGSTDVRTYVRMSDHGPSYIRFQRSLRTGNLDLVRAAAAELPVVALDDALAILLLY